MRSILETKWAELFDYYDIKWFYEVEGYKFNDGTCYLPDFYLPDMKAYFECKGVMTNEDEKKIHLLAVESQKPVITGYPDGSFDLTQIPIAAHGGCNLCYCDICGKYTFYDTQGTWLCFIHNGWQEFYDGIYGDDHNLYEGDYHNKIKTTH